MFVERPRRGDDIRVLRTHKKSSALEGFFVLLSVPAGGMIFESSALVKNLPLWRAFYFVECPRRGMIFESSELTKNIPLWRAFLFY